MKRRLVALYLSLFIIGIINLMVQIGIGSISAFASEEMKNDSHLKGEQLLANSSASSSSTIPTSPSSTSSSSTSSSATSISTSSLLSTAATSPNNTQDYFSLVFYKQDYHNRKIGEEMYQITPLPAELIKIVNSYLPFEGKESKIIYKEDKRANVIEWSKYHQLLVLPAESKYPLGRIAACVLQDVENKQWGIRIWDVSTFKNLDLEGPLPVQKDKSNTDSETYSDNITEQVLGMAALPANQLAAINYGRVNSIGIWNTYTGKMVGEIKSAGNIVNMSVSPTGNLAFTTADYDESGDALPGSNAVYISKYDSKNNHYRDPEKVINSEDFIYSLSFLKDGSLVTGYQGKVEFWNVEENKKLGEFSLGIHSASMAVASILELSSGELALTSYSPSSEGFYSKDKVYILPKDRVKGFILPPQEFTIGGSRRKLVELQPVGRILTATDSRSTRSFRLISRDSTGIWDRDNNTNNFIRPLLKERRTEGSNSEFINDLKVLPDGRIVISTWNSIKILY